MPVIDSGRFDDYDFSYQRATSASTYSVLWQVVKLNLSTSNIRESVLRLKAYTGGALNPDDRLIRLLRTRVWLGKVRMHLLSFSDADFLDDYKLETLLDYREQINSLCPPKFNGRRVESSTDKYLLWDWNNVRQDLRRLFINDPTTFVDMRMSLRPSNRRFLREEYNYFIWLCDEETYVRHSVPPSS
jgi:hypothetical protein